MNAMTMRIDFAGQACDMTAISDVAAACGAFLVEDAAHAFPATHCGRMIGTIGNATVFSFYATKTIATGEGGMVVTDDPAIAERVKVMRLHGISHDVFDRYTSSKLSWFYEVIAPGYKYNLTDIASAIGVQQLRRADEFRAVHDCAHGRRRCADHRPGSGGGTGVDQESRD